MKLDPRIIEGKKPLGCFDIEEAKEFIGKEGLFGTHESQFMNLDTYPKCGRGELKEVDDYDDHPYTTIGNASYRLFLPAEWVKGTEKKYRAFSLNEFLERFKIGNTVTFRMKKGEHVPEAECRVEYTRLITGYETLPENRDIPGKSSILLGGCPPTTLARLFEFYELENEYYFPTVWQPFGCLVKGDGK